jgi:hypothetical protein
MSKLLYKNIFTVYGKKVAGSCSEKLIFGTVNQDNIITTVSFKDWTNSPLEDKSSDDEKFQITKNLAKQITQINKLVDYNLWCKANPTLTFEQKVNKLFEFGCKFPKSGLKIS